MPRQKKTVSRRKRILWTATDLKTLRKSAGSQGLAQIARAMKRTPAAVQRKAHLEGISLRRRKA